MPMNKRSMFILIIIIAFAAACAQTPAELQVVRDAASALGGVDRIQAAKTLTIEGEGAAPNVGQNTMPDGELPVWKVTTFKRTVDLAAGRMRVQQVRSAQFLFAGATVQRLDQGLDADVAYNVGQDGAMTRAGDQAMRGRRIEMLHHPVSIVRGALDPGAKIANRRQEGNEQRVDLPPAKGEMLTLAIDATTRLPLRVTSMSDNPNMGDVPIS